jgi:hypothetical protein
MLECRWQRRHPAASCFTSRGACPQKRRNRRRRAGDVDARQRRVLRRGVPAHKNVAIDVDMPAKLTPGSVAPYVGVFPSYVAVDVDADAFSLKQHRREKNVDGPSRLEGSGVVRGGGELERRDKKKNPPGQARPGRVLVST